MHSSALRDRRQSASQSLAEEQLPEHQRALGRLFHGVTRVAIASVLALFATSPSALAQSNGPVAAYSFNASSGTTLTDVTGHNNTINLHNGPGLAGGKYGNALSFDGSNDVGIASSANSALNLTGRSFTLSAWINPRSNSGWQLIVDKPYTSAHTPPYFDWSMHRENSTGRLNAFLGCEVVQRPSNSSTLLNTWTHVAVTYDGSALRHYINGVLDRTTTVTCPDHEHQLAPDSHRRERWRRRGHERAHRRRAHLQSPVIGRRNTGRHGDASAGRCDACGQGSALGRYRASCCRCNSQRHTERQCHRNG